MRHATRESWKREVRAWLEAFIWPEQLAGLEMLRSATVTTLAGRIQVISGDAKEDLVRLLSQVLAR